MKLVFQATAWNECHSESGSGIKNYVIQIFGRTYNDHDVCLEVIGFKPYFYVEINPSWGKIQIEQFVEAVKKKAGYMGEKNDRYEYNPVNEFIRHSVTKKQTFARFEHNKMRTLLKLEFDSRHAMDLYSSALAGEITMDGKKAKYERYESNIEPILRFIHINNIQPSSWIEIDLKKAKDITGYSVCDLNYQIYYEHVLPKDMGTEIAPIKIASYDIECISSGHEFPQAANVTDKLIQIGFDVARFGSPETEEAYILTLKRCDPIPGVKVLCYKTEKGLIKGFANIIRRIRPDIRTGYYISGFDDEYVWDRALKLDEVKAAHKRIKYHQLPIKLREYLLKYGGKLNYDYLAKHRNIQRCLSEFQVKKLASSAMGENILKLFNTPGIVNIDMIKIIQREHNLSSYSLDNVSSHFINEKVKSMDVQDNEVVVHTKSTKALEADSYIQLMFTNGYDVSPLVLDQKYYVKKVTQTSFTITMDARTQKKFAKALTKQSEDSQKYGVSWTFAKDEMPYSDLAKHFHNGDPKMIQLIAKYCWKDCKLVNLIIFSLDTPISLISMSNVCYVPMSYLVSRGQGIKVFSRVSLETLQTGKVIPLMADKNATEESAYYEGATVIEPEVGIHNTPIVTLDFNSLYPRCIQRNNGSPDTFVSDPKYDNLEGYIYNDVFVKVKGKDKKYVRNPDGTIKVVHYRFAQKIVTDKDIRRDLKHIVEPWEERIADAETRKYVIESDLDFIEAQVGDVIRSKLRAKLLTALQNAYETELTAGKDEIYNFIEGKYVKYGTLPSILTKLLSERAKVTKQMKVETDPAKRKVLNGRQLALKITANSAYGLTGYPKSAIYCKAVAESTTATGRNMLYTAKSIVEENFPGSRVIYGDTDSIFIDFGLKDEDGNVRNDKKALAEAIQLGQQAAALINSKIDKPQNIVYEKTFLPFIIISKKRYIGHLYEHDVNSYAVKIMGLMLKRRDNAPIAKIAVGTVVTSIMSGDPIELTFEKLSMVLQKMVDGGYDLSKYTTSKTLRAHYDNPKRIAHKVLADRMAERDPGSAPKPNDRIPYVYIVKDTRMLPKGRKLLQGDYVETPDYLVKCNLKVDYLRYIINQIMEPASQFLGLAVSEKTLTDFFDQYIIPERNKQQGVRTIDEWLLIPRQKKALVIEKPKPAPVKNPIGMSLMNWAVKN